MTSIPGSDVSIFHSNLLFDLSFVKCFSYCLESSNKNLIWSDEQTRFFLQLRLDESLKGNIRKQMVNEAERQVIMDKFYEAFGIKIPWRKFGIKYNTCKKQYDSFKKLTRNRTGLGFTSTGSINMSEDWWNERCKVQLQASFSRNTSKLNRSEYKYQTQHTNKFMQRQISRS
ncbi:hypothetical protein YC2023_058410 [Brassica napus]